MYPDAITVENQDILHKIVPGDGMKAMTGNSGHHPGAINPTGEIIRVMTQHGTYLVISIAVPDVIGTHHRVPLKAFLHPVKDIRGIPSGQYHPSQTRDYRRSPQQSDDSNWRTSPKRDNQRYHSPPPPRATQGFKSSSDSTMRPSSMGEKSNVTFSDSVKSLN